MNLSYELAKELKEAGFPQKRSEFYYRLGYHTTESFDKGVSLGKKGIFSDEFHRTHYPHPRYSTGNLKWNQADLSKLDETEVACPTLSELIEACGDDFFGIKRSKVAGVWGAWVYADAEVDDTHCLGSTPEEAVAKLWLALNSNNNQL